MEVNPNILIVETDPQILSVMEERLSLLGLDRRSIAAPDITINQLESLSPDLAVLGPFLEKEPFLKCINRLKILDPVMPILTCRDDLALLGGPAGISFEGFHPLSPDLEPDEISSAVKSALKYKSERRNLPNFPILIGQSQVITSIRQKIQKVCDKDINILITGETGSGKDLIARSIHYHSPRNKGPLVKIDCGVLPSELLESEVFGYQRGAFTDAHKDKPGRIELANGGTLFIDEIGNLSLPLQAKFLQVLEDREFSRLGGIQDKAVDIRLVAVTNTDLWKKVGNGTFRKDLFYRLNVVHIEVPPLRDRKDDILLLSHYFLNKYCFELKKDPLEIPDDIAGIFLTYRWPGNIRELENVIRRAIVLKNFDFMLKELELKAGDHDTENPSFPDGISPNLGWHDDKVRRFFNRHDFSLKTISKAYVSEVERQAILRALNETQWNRKKAAQLLQVSYKTLLNRIQEFDLTSNRK
jgi:two-component system response regulator AtoC